LIARKEIGMLNEDRIVITGIGVVSPIGIGKDAFWQGLKEGRSGIKPVTLFDTSCVTSKLAGQIDNFNAEFFLGTKGLRNMDRATLFVLCASKMALEDSGLRINQDNQNDIGVALGSTTSHVWSISEFDKERIKNGQQSVNPALFPNTVMNSPAGQISIFFSIKGFNVTISTGFSSSIDAIEYARQFISLGRVKAVLTGGIEVLTEHFYKGFSKSGFLSSSKNGGEFCSPFDRRRNGAILGEGSVMFLLESEKHARSRNAKIYAEYRGASSSCDLKAYNKYNLRSQLPFLTIKNILERNRLSPQDIDYVASSANSTYGGDYLEARSIHKALQRNHEKVLCSSSKSMIGETFSASGAFQIATALFAIKENSIPPTINHVDVDARCEVDCVPNRVMDRLVRNVMVPMISPMNQTVAAIVSKYNE
jgi:3-oxoacyl-[acyl-carrier-protein] synthase II